MLCAQCLTRSLRRPFSAAIKQTSLPPVHPLILAIPYISHTHHNRLTHLTMLTRRLALVALLVGAAAAIATAAAIGKSDLPSNVRMIASGYTWAENLHFTAGGQLFTTELTSGSVFLIEPDGQGHFNKRLWLADPSVSSLLGLASDPSNVNLWTVGHGKDAAGDPVNLVGQFNSTHEMSWKQIASLPKKGNGLAFHAASGVLYATSEGNFLPGDGSLYRINVTSGEVSEVVVKPSAHRNKAMRVTRDIMHRGMSALPKLAAREGEEFVQSWLRDIEKLLHKDVEATGKSDLWGADGLWIDEYSSTLFVGELLTGQVWALSLPSHEPLGVVASIKGLSATPLLDDFTLSQDRGSIVAASWGNSSIVATGLGSDKPLNPRTILDGLNNPTSARWGPLKSPHWSSTSLFVSEGKNVFPWQHDCRILEIKDAAKWLAGAGEAEAGRVEGEGNNPRIATE